MGAHGNGSGALTVTGVSAVIYGAGKYFLCRHCYDLTYASQQENVNDRKLRKANRIKERLGGSLQGPFPWKPKNMHWKTYWRLREEAVQAESSAWAAICQKSGFPLP